jgi:hypothetical protein
VRAERDGDALVVPRMLRSPVTAKVVASTRSTAVEANVIAGWWAASRNLSRRALSRRGLWVSMLRPGRSAWTVDFEGSSPDTWA